MLVNVYFCNDFSPMLQAAMTSRTPRATSSLVIPEAVQCSSKMGSKEAVKETPHALSRMVNVTRTVTGHFGIAKKRSHPKWSHLNLRRSREQCNGWTILCSLWGHVPTGADGIRAAIDTLQFHRGQLLTALPSGWSSGDHWWPNLDCSMIHFHMLSVVVINWCPLQLSDMLLISQVYNDACPLWIACRWWQTYCT